MITCEMVGAGVAGAVVVITGPVGIGVAGAKVFNCGAEVLGIEDAGTGVTGTGGLLLGAGDSGVPNVGKGETGKLVAGPGVDGVGGRDDWSDRVQKLTSSAPISNSCTNVSSRRCCCLALYRFICPFCLLRRNRDRPVLCSSAAAVANSAPVAERHAATIITDFRPMFNCYIIYPLVVFITLQYHSIINQARSRMKASYQVLPTSFRLELLVLVLKNRPICGGNGTFILRK